MTEIHWSPRASDNYRKIFAIMEKEDSPLARKFTLGIKSLLTKMDRFPSMGRMVPEIQNPEIREVFWKSYRLIYRVRNEMIEILTIRHGRRQFSLS